jgi:hypothetical protein
MDTACGNHQEARIVSREEYNVSVQEVSTDVWKMKLPVYDTTHFSMLEVTLTWDDVTGSTILWLSPTVFISTHLYQFPLSISLLILYTIQLIVSRDSTVDTTIRIYTVDTDSAINNNDNHPRGTTPALDFVCQFLQRLLASVPIDYFAQIKLWQSIVLPLSAAHPLRQPVLSVRMDEITSFHLGGECDISVFKDIVATQMNHNVRSVRLDMWSLHLPHHQSEEANLPSMMVSLIDKDGVSSTLLNGIKNNPKLVTFRLNMMYGKKMQQNIQNLCCYALDGNTSLSRLVVYIDDDDDEDDDRELVDDSNNSRITVPFRPLDTLFTELASCKNGLNLQFIHVTRACNILARVVSLGYDDDEEDRDLIALGESDIVIDGMETFVLNFKRESVLDFILDPLHAGESIQRRLQGDDHRRQRKECVASLVNHLKLTGEIPHTHEDMKIFNSLLILLDAKLHESVQSFFL